MPLTYQFRPLTHWPGPPSPDAGGRAEDFKQVQQARDVLLGAAR
jgi:hypothetical protein